MKFAVYVLIIASVSSLAFAKSTTETSVASSVIIQEIIAKRLLVAKYDAILSQALERTNGSEIGALENCDPAAGSFTCDLKVRANSKRLKLSVSINQGTVTSAEVR